MVNQEYPTGPPYANGGRIKIACCAWYMPATFLLQIMLRYVYDVGVTFLTSTPPLNRATKESCYEGSYYQCEGWW